MQWIITRRKNIPTFLIFCCATWTSIPVYRTFSTVWFFLMTKSCTLSTCHFHIVYTATLTGSPCCRKDLKCLQHQKLCSDNRRQYQEQLPISCISKVHISLSACGLVLQSNFIHCIYTIMFTIFIPFCCQEGSWTYIKIPNDH